MVNNKSISQLANYEIQEQSRSNLIALYTKQSTIILGIPIDQIFVPLWNISPLQELRAQIQETKHQPLPETMGYQKTGRAWRGPSGQIWYEIVGDVQPNHVRLLPELRTGRSDQSITVSDEFLKQLGWTEIITDNKQDQ